MNEARAIARCEEAAALLPPRFRRAALQMPDIASDTRRSSVCVPDSPPPHCYQRARSRCRTSARTAA